MPFNSTLFINICAAIWVIGGSVHFCNVLIAKSDEEKFKSLVAGFLMLGVIGVCMVL